MPQLTDPSEREHWAINAQWAKLTGRNNRYYKKVFNIDETERVLDLGAGYSRHAPPNTVRYDYKYAKRLKPKIGVNVGGIFQELPFASKSFNRVTASFSFYWVKEGAVEAVCEALRVLKPDGVLQISPAGERNKDLARRLEAEGLAARQAHTRFRVPVVAAAIGAVGGGLLMDAITGVGHEPFEVIAASSGLGGLALGGEGYYMATGRTLSIYKENIPDEAYAIERTALLLTTAYNFSQYTPRLIALNINGPGGEDTKHTYIPIDK